MGTEIREVVSEVMRPGVYCGYTVEEEDEKNGTAVHLTYYLNFKDGFRKNLPGILAKLLNLAEDVDKEKEWNLLSRTSQWYGVRCVEIHEMFPGGGVTDWEHHDMGSLITIAVMLEEATE